MTKPLRDVTVTVLDVPAIRVLIVALMRISDGGPDWASEVAQAALDETTRIMHDDNARRQVIP